MMSRVGAPMAVSETLVWQTVGDRVARQVPPTDPICAFHVLFKFMKRVLFQNIVQPLRSASNKFPFESACCSVALLSARQFLSDAFAAEATRFCRVHQNPRALRHGGGGVQGHEACSAPLFPTAIMDKIFACNHILLSHLVSGDAITVIMEQALRKAMSQSRDFFVVINLIVEDMQVRARKHPRTGYAFEAVSVTFQNYIMVDSAGEITQRQGEVEKAVPCQWSITFPARKAFAAFVANRERWLKLDHVPVFNALEVGQSMAAEMKRSPMRHVASPLLCSLITRQRIGTGSGGARAVAPTPGFGSSKLT